MDLGGLYATYRKAVHRHHLAPLAISGKAASTPPCSIPPTGPPLLARVHPSAAHAGTDEGPVMQNHEAPIGAGPLADFIDIRDL